MRTGLGLASLVIAALLGLAGLGLCVWAAYLGLSAQMGSITAALILGVLLMLFAGLVTWIAIRLTR